MRTGKLTGDEILATEMAADKRRQGRGNGFIKMKERDQGFVHLSNGVLMLWPTVESWSEGTTSDGTTITLRTDPNIREGEVILDGKRYDAEELRKYLRWA